MNNFSEGVRDDFTEDPGDQEDIGAPQLEKVDHFVPDSGDTWHMQR